MKCYTQGFCDKCGNADKKLQSNSKGQWVCSKCLDTPEDTVFKSDCLLDMDKEFRKDLDKIVGDEWRSIVADFKGKNHIVYAMEVGVDNKVSHQFFNKHFPNILDTTDLGISFIASVFNSGAGVTLDINYLYKGRVIEPKDYYLRPKDYIEVPIKIIIDEAVSQGTHNPDLMNTGLQDKLKELAKQKLAK